MPLKFLYHILLKFLQFNMQKKINSPHPTKVMFSKDTFSRYPWYSEVANSNTNPTPLSTRFTSTSSVPLDRFFHKIFLLEARSSGVSPYFCCKYVVTTPRIRFCCGMFGFFSFEL